MSGFDRIVGYENEKRELEQLRQMLHQMDYYRQVGIKIPRGVILCGAPGIGKSVLARSVAEDGIKLYEIDSTDGEYDEVEEQIRYVFSEAKKNAPAVVLIDELDKVVGECSGFFMEANFSTRKVIIQELDKLTGNDGVLVVGTCNEVDGLGESFYRSGRFDRILMMELPNLKTRQAIVQYYLDKINLPKECDSEEIARLTAGYSGADLECLINETGIHAVSGSKKIITEEIISVMNKMDFDGEMKPPIKDEKLMRQIAVHEAGHAIVALCLKPEELHTVTIQPQGKSLGHCKMNGGQECGSSVKDVEKDICILLAGRTAEKLELKEMYLGSADDLNKAVQGMKYLITQQGAYGTKYMLGGKMSFNGLPQGQECDYVTVFEKQMDRLEEAAKKMLLRYSTVFSKMVDTLMEKQTIEKSELLEFQREMREIKRQRAKA